MVECLICEKETNNFVCMEFDFAVCRKCFDSIFPYLVKQAVLGNDKSILLEARYHARNTDR